MAIRDEIDVSGWSAVQGEPMGAAGKVWLVDANERRWLWKPRRSQRDRRHGEFPRGEDWAEIIASAAAEAIGLPSAYVAPASWAAVPGSISLDITGGRRLVGGNELLYALDTSYPFIETGTVTGYSLGRILTALGELGVEAPPCPAVPDQTAASVFAGYLVLDAWIANTDRHHGNWGVLDDQAGILGPVLSPAFDHGSSLGFQLHDDEKRQLLEDGLVQQWASRGRCRPMEGRPRLTALALTAVSEAGPAAHHWLDRLTSVSADDHASILDTVPEARMSQVSRRFAEVLMTTNRRRLLDGS